jgi:inosine-uridine nucleoside N-ribohydrolase
LTAGGPLPIVIDTDAGVDDAAALFWAVTSPDVDVLAITVVHGNLGTGRGAVDGAAANVCRVLEAAGRVDIPVYVGEIAPMGPVPPLRRADFIHGSDGLGDTGLPPASFGARDDRSVDEVFAEVAAQRPGDVQLVTLGPLTNVGRAVERGALDPGAWRRLVAMGGAIAVPGNALPAAEANIAHDPVAAAVAFGATFAEPTLLVGLDVTHRATFTADEVALLDRRATPAAAFLAGPLGFYARAAGTFCAPGEFPCHDLLAVLAAAYELVTGPVLPLGVQTAPGPAWCATIADRRVPFFERAGAGSAQAALPGFAACEVGLHVDVEAFRRHVRQLLSP